MLNETHVEKIINNKLYHNQITPEQTYEILNQIAYDETFSLKERGLLFFLAWDLNGNILHQIQQTSSGRTSFQSTLNGLVQKGVLIKTIHRTSDGRVYGSSICFDKRWLGYD